MNPILYDFITHRMSILEVCQLATNKGEMKCLRCGSKMKYIGKEKFQVGGGLPVLGGTFGLFQRKRRFELYFCPSCRRVEFFDMDEPYWD